MNPGSALKAIVGVFSFGENLELVFIHDTSVKEMHTDQAVSVFEVREHPGCLWRPYAGERGDAFVLQDDNARPHRTRIMNTSLELKTVQRMHWSARSPDLNPIKHVWDALG
ncbi:transposable element Tc1 transposase [Trichonephila clavipes]|nr:transposable element Tc1 transposase [Trichonephila clavipes]